MNHASPPVTGGSGVPRLEFGAPEPAPLRIVPIPRVESTSSSIQPPGPDFVAPPIDATDYPDLDQVIPGQTSRVWRLPTADGAGFVSISPVVTGVTSVGTDGVPVDDRTLVFRGTLIGMSTNRRSTHTGHAATPHAPTTVRCTGCRWFETRVYRLDTTDSEALAGMRYVLHFVGRSLVPGERDLPRHEVVRGGHEVVESYTMRKPGEQPFITKPGARVLAQAATYDAAIEDAYVNRATA